MPEDVLKRVYKAFATGGSILTGAGISEELLKSSLRKGVEVAIPITRDLVEKSVIAVGAGLLTYGIAGLALVRIRRDNSDKSETKQK